VEQDKKPETNYWPYAIVGMILTVVLLGIWTIKVAVSNPVQEDRSYMMKYQDVDANINEILAQQRAFDAKYTIDLSMNRLHTGQNRVQVEVREKNGQPADVNEIVAVVTRPTSAKEDIELKSFSEENGRYVSQPFELKRGGRWNIEVRVKTDSGTGFKTYKTFVKE
jgi:nitrogen fixation protein FixH